MKTFCLIAAAAALSCVRLSGQGLESELFLTEDYLKSLNLELSYEITVDKSGGVEFQKSYVKKKGEPPAPGRKDRIKLSYDAPPKEGISPITSIKVDAAFSEKGIKVKRTLGDGAWSYFYMADDASFVYDAPAENAGGKHMVLDTEELIKRKMSKQSHPFILDYFTKDVGGFSDGSYDWKPWHSILEEMVFNGGMSISADIGNPEEKTFTFFMGTKKMPNMNSCKFVFKKMGDFFYPVKFEKATRTSSYPGIPPAFVLKFENYELLADGKNYFPRKVVYEQYFTMPWQDNDGAVHYDPPVLLERHTINITKMRQISEQEFADCMPMSIPSGARIQNNLTGESTVAGDVLKLLNESSK